MAINTLYLKNEKFIAKLIICLIQIGLTNKQKQLSQNKRKVNLLIGKAIQFQ